MDWNIRVRMQSHPKNSLGSGRNKLCEKNQPRGKNIKGAELIIEGAKSPLNAVPGCARRGRKADENQ